MKYLLILPLIALLLIPQVFAEESFNGYSSIDPPLSEIISGQSTVMTIRFLYTSGPYAMNNFIPIIEVNPSSARQFVQVDVDSIEITQGQIKRIPVTLTTDPHIDHDKIFLSISYAGNHFMSGEIQKSSWNDQVMLDVVVNEKPIPEPESEQYSPVHENCGPGTTLQNGICVVDKTKENYSDSFVRWGGPAYNHDIKSPLKQIKSGISFENLQCMDGLVLLQKHDGSPACVTESTKQKLIERGWTENPVKINTTIKPIPYDPMLAKKITESNNQFTLDFYKQTSKEKNENIFFSSPSISTAFSILYEGAKGDTATEIQDVFGFPTDDHERQIGFVTFINTLNQKNNDENTVQMSNALWLANGFSPLPTYTNTAQTYYGSLIDTVSFATDAGRLEINDWVKSKTQNRIDELLVPGSTTSLTKMVITNTIYFKGEWSYPFDPENTYDGDFVVDSTRTVTVPMMTYEHKMNFNHTSTEQMQILQMPYKGNSFSMLVILPHDAEDMQLVEDSLTLDNLDLWKSQFRDFRGTIHIPKFTLDAEYDLKEILSDMGISSVFGSADLSGITGYKGLFVSKAVHKAFVEVNEVGTEAAAATAIITDESGGRLFKADHPFIFLIQDNTTNDILFIGKVMDPTK